MAVYYGAGKRLVEMEKERRKGGINPKNMRRKKFRRKWMVLMCGKFGWEEVWRYFGFDDLRGMKKCFY